CDEFNLKGEPKPHTEVRDTYTHAQKIRAACTYGFGRVHGLGNVPWHQSEVTVKWVGNPSVSETVSTYMVSLRHRKVVRAGEAPTSARAVTADDLRRLYKYNTHPDRYTVKEHNKHNLPKTTSSDWFCGGLRHRMLTLAYGIAFTCLLRVDEVLRMEHHHIKWIDENTLEISLDYCKTSQFGNIQPFVLHKFPAEMAHLCVVRAYASWVHASGI
ncbi:hypothetical protein C8J56DRAFT_756859, partial [Mycena floridula]